MGARTPACPAASSQQSRPPASDASNLITGLRRFWGSRCGTTTCSPDFSTRVTKLRLPPPAFYDGQSRITACIACSSWVYADWRLCRIGLKRFIVRWLPLAAGARTAAIRCLSMPIMMRAFGVHYHNSTHASANRIALRFSTHASASSSAFAFFRSTVSKPSVNQPWMGASSSRASLRRPCSPHSSAILIAARSS